MYRTCNVQVSLLPLDLGRSMQYSMQNMNPLMRKPSAWFPVILSLVALGIMIIHITMFGAVREADEGTGAHLFQIWLVLELFLVAFFAVMWLPKAPKEALLILTVQIVAALAVCAPVFYFKL